MGLYLSTCNNNSVSYQTDQSPFTLEKLKKTTCVTQLKTLKMSMTLAVMKRLKWKVLIEVSHYPKGKLVFPQPFCLVHGPGLEELFASTIAYCTGATLSLQDPS